MDSLSPFKAPKETYQMTAITVAAAAEGLPRIFTPTRLERIMAAWAQPNPPQFQVGDEIEFEKSDGWRWIITILGRSADGKFECMVWDGRPHFLSVDDEETLTALRIVKRGRMDEESIAMYRDLLDLEAA